MIIKGISDEQSKALTRLLQYLSSQIEADAIIVSDYGGNILSHIALQNDESLQTIAALAAGAFAATRELARFIKEPEFLSVFHRGRESNIFIQCLASQYLILAIVNKKTAQGLVKLCMERMASQFEAVLTGASAQSILEAASLTPFEIKDGDVFGNDEDEDNENDTGDSS